jgi:hypothetical protein
VPSELVESVPGGGQLARLDLSLEELVEQGPEGQRSRLGLRLRGVSGLSMHRAGRAYGLRPDQVPRNQPVRKVGSEHPLRTRQNNRSSL